ncbi:DUF1611 domain-containing protein [Agrococcus beijingensis]|uniref:DUF1611 domain-containing protein n=1 Tax=Agrococcus beijingensis TaxID=3068634 RepID=UPI0027423CA3|nr:DUF1611 domain-containing protein [Agrococcus sp. REN33]
MQTTTLTAAAAHRTDAQHGLDASAAPLPAGALTRVKRAYSTRRVDLGRAVATRTDLAPANGDLVLATVTALGQHRRLELPDGRRAPLREGEQIVVAFSNRYAPDQFEAVVPDDLGPTSLVAGGGLAGRVLSRHAGMAEATALLPVGLLADADGRVLNVADGALSPEAAPQRPPVIAVVGASMNSGKTTTAAKLVQGITAGGVRVGAIKITGTGSGGDIWSFRDHGAHTAYDFSDFGHASTAGMGVDAVARILRGGIAQLTADGAQAIVIEVADGVFQHETAAIIEHDAFDELVDAVLFAAPDALSALGGAAWLTSRGRAPIALSGVVTASALATRELRAETATPVWDIAQLTDAAHAKGVLVTARERRDR